MSRQAVHQSRMYTNRFGTHFTTTLCARMSNAGADLNVADSDDQVTCKLCLKRMALKIRRTA